MKFILTVCCLLLSFSSFAINKRMFLKMSDQQLWEAGLAKSVGKCVISDARKCTNCACDYYVKSSKKGLEHGGLPSGHGTGCLVAPSLSKAMATCWSSPNVYDTYNDSATPICTDDYVKNAANMLRIGIANGICD